MTHTRRRILFYLFVFIFLVATPSIILYSTGYTYDWNKKKIVYTGAIYLESEPNGAKISINGKYINTTKYSIKRLIPKEYSVSIQKDGFYPWQKKLEVQAGLVTEARNILLVPQNPKLTKAGENVTDMENYLKNETEKEKDKTAQATITNLAASKKIASWARSGDLIYYLANPDLSLYKANLDGSNELQLTTEPLLLPSQQSNETISYRLIPKDDQRVAILDSKKNLYNYSADEKKIELLSQGVTDASFSNDDKKLLYWDEHEIWVYYLEEIKVQPYRKAGKKNLITRYAQNISQAIWYLEDNEHIIFVVGDEIKITELDDRDVRNTYDFINTKRPKIYYKQKDNFYNTSSLYILSEDTLYQTQIATPENLIPNPLAN